MEKKIAAKKAEYGEFVQDYKEDMEKFERE